MGDQAASDLERYISIIHGPCQHEGVLKSAHSSYLGISQIIKEITSELAVSLFQGHKSAKTLLYKMARTTSEVDCLIEASEISSHPEGESVAENTRDSDDVCSLETKDCEEIMKHLQSNPGFIVKSLGPEGRIVLHVAVIAGTTKKPHPLVSEGTQSGLRRAADGSDWDSALFKLDCKALMALLQENPCLVVQTGFEGRTVLHAATEKGCLQLLDQVFDLFEDSGQSVNVQSGVRITLRDLCDAKCGDSEALAADYAQFTCSEFVHKNLSFVSRDAGSFSSTQSCSSDASQHLKDEVVRIMQEESTNKAFESLEESTNKAFEGMEDDYQNHPDYNFVLERKELQFHYACRYIKESSRREYVASVITGCLRLGPSQSVEVLTYLFQLQNAQGQTPFHVALNWGDESVETLLKLIPGGDAYKECLNARDVRGWTTLHHAAATCKHDSLEALLKDQRVDANIRTPDRRENPTTALHLAILHDDAKSVELLLNCPRTDVNALFGRYIVCGYERLRPGDNISEIGPQRWYLSPLQLAAIMGLSNVVRTLLALKLPAIFDDGKVVNENVLMKSLDENFRRISALLLAAASGSSDTLRLFLDNPMFNPLVKFEGATALHYGTDAMMPYSEGLYSASPRPILLSDGQVNRFLFVEDFAKADREIKFDDNISSSFMEKKTTVTSYLGKQACITMLLQAGIDIWEKDDQDRFAEPGPQAPEEAHLWWHERIARETFEAKKSLNDAANAISVVAALVATASFVGPLQPPLGYGQIDPSPDLYVVQDTHLSVRVFMVSNSLSFYLAVASIMFAVVPSLPMPQEGIYAEWQRTRRTVAMAIFFLLMSVLGVLISFGAASNSVVSEEYSWKHGGLSFYPVLVGGFVCLIGIILFFLRLLRLVFNRNAKIRYLYKAFVKF